MKRDRRMNAGPAQTCASVALVLLLTAGGCDRRDAGSVAVDKSSVGLHAISGGNVRKAPDAYVQSEMPKVATEAKTAIDGEGGTKAAGSIISAQSALSLAEIALANVVELDRQAAEKRLEIRRQASTWSERGASAVVSAAFNPSDVIAKLDAEKTAKQGEIATLQTAKAQIDARLKQLRTDAKGKLDQANAMLSDYEAKRGDVAKLSATEAARVLEATQGIKKQADTLRLEGERILAQISVLEPDASAKALEIEQRQNQIASVETAIVDLSKRAADAKTDAVAAKAAQQKAGEAIAAGATELRDFREGKLKDAIDGAAKTVKGAITTIKGASGDPGAGGKLVLAKAQQTLGDLTFTHGQTLAQYAQLMNHLATVTPPLPEASRYADDAKKAKDDAKEALEEATKAYEAAQSAYESTPLKGEVKERLKKVGESLGKVVAMSSGANADASAAAMPDDLRAFVSSLIEKAKTDDAAAMVDSYHFPSPEIGDAMKKMGEAMKPMGRVNAACKAKFGKTLDDAAGSMGMKMQFGGSTAELKAADPAALTATLEGDKATVMSGGKPLFTAGKYDGAWKLELPPEVAAAGPQLAMALPMIQALGAQMGTLADDVEAGKFKSIEEVVGALMQRMQGAMGAPGGSGGPSGGEMNK